MAGNVRLRAVCHPWRRHTTDPRVYGLDRRCHPRQWIMLQEELAPSHRRCFLNVSTSECIKLDLPELRDHETLGRTSEGLLFLLHKRTNIRLLNPLKRHLEELPPLITLLPPYRYTYLISTTHFEQCMTAWGCGITDDSVVVSYLHKLRILAVAKPGDERWTSVSYKSHPSKPLVFLGRFYCVTEDNLMVLKTSLDQPPRMEVAAELCRPLCSTFHSMHMVDNGGELMLVHRMLRSSPRRFDYDLYRLDLEMGKFFPANSFNGRALFMARHCSLSVSTKVFPSISSDTIYMSFDLDERVSMQIQAYNVVVRGTELASYILNSSTAALPSPLTLVDCLSLCNVVKLNCKHLASVI
ncbi:uncharacterized protein LOC125510836 [Triticum urartu]|uniref:uncharacterized protein LOC125510836 n=1 Tax=Triticum urartu TaxID=4572 RepID=UPI0020434FF3|nr:uncharacterized protein LOC125510836 [Triticum urartu]